MTKNFGGTVLLFIYSVDIQDNHCLGHLNSGLFPGELGLSLNIKGTKLRDSE